MSIKSICTSLIFYPLFILPYLMYYILYKLKTFIHYWFKLIYIEKICGYNKSFKIINSINSLGKRPQVVTIVIDFNSFYGDDKKITLLCDKIVNCYLKILDSLNQLKYIHLFIYCSQNDKKNLIFDEFERKINKSKVKLVKNMKQSVQQINKDQCLHTPLIIIFSQYETTCNLPSKYLVNAELSFNEPIQISTKYNLLQSFCQYSTSKQRNGK